MADQEKAIVEAQPVAPARAGLDTAEGFALLQRVAKMFSTSSMVPERFRGPANIGNCIIAINMANRLKADYLMVMQNLYVVNGTPGWSAQFAIATFNQCGRYSSIRYKPTGKPGTDTQGIIAYAAELSTGEVIEGPEVTIAIAKAEGWYGKNGSKWKTMPDQMLRYRAAAWLIRTTAPEILMGFMTDDEIIDVTPEPINSVAEEIRANANTEVFEAAPPAGETPEEAAPEAAASPEGHEAASVGPGF